MASKEDLPRAIKLLHGAVESLERVQMRKDSENPHTQRLANMSRGAARSYIEEAYELIDE